MNAEKNGNLGHNHMSRLQSLKQNIDINLSF